MSRPSPPAPPPGTGRAAPAAPPADAAAPAATAGTAAVPAAADAAAAPRAAAEAAEVSPAAQVAGLSAAPADPAGVSPATTAARPAGGSGRPAVARLPLLAGAALALVAGLWGGLARLEVAPVPREAFAAEHGPLMALGFLGTLIALERAVSLRRRWAYAAPALGGLGAIALAAGLAQAGRVALTAAAGWLVACYVVVVLERRPGRAVGVQLTGALAWYGGGLLWLRGHPVADLVPWTAAFLVLTIAGERLELAHVAFLRRRAADGLIATAGLLVAGVLISVPLPGAGWRVAGVGMLALAGWLAVFDVARRTVRGAGLTRFTAVCLLGGYAWLAVGGLLWAVAARPDGGLYDAALHAVFLGFVMSMVFGHAPVILPAVLRVRLPYGPAMYGPLALLHLALAARVAGDLAGIGPARAIGGVLGEVALAGFACCAVAAALRARRRVPKEPS